MEKKEKAGQKKSVGIIEFERVRGQQVLFIKVDPEIEELFKTEDTKNSQTYHNDEGKGLQYYGLTKEVSQIAEKFNNPMFGRNIRILLSDYGTALYRDGGINFSVLRTKGLSEGVRLQVDTIVIDNEVKQWMHDFGQFLKHLYINFIEKRQVKCTVSIEV